MRRDNKEETRDEIRSDVRPPGDKPSAVICTLILESNDDNCRWDTGTVDRDASDINGYADGQLCPDTPWTGRR